MSAHDFENVNQMHTAYRRWVAGKPYKRLALNWMRNIARVRGDHEEAPPSHAPQLDKVAQLAEFFQVPLYMLLVEDVQGDPQFAMRMNRVVATYVNGPESVRQAIDALMQILTTHTPTTPTVRTPPSFAFVKKA